MYVLNSNIFTRSVQPNKRKHALKVKDRLKQHTKYTFEPVAVRDTVKTNCLVVFTWREAADAWLIANLNTAGGPTSKCGAPRAALRQWDRIDYHINYSNTRNFRNS